MKKRYRFLLILVAAGASASTSSGRPSGGTSSTPQADKDIAESSRNQIKVYAQERGRSRR